MRPSVLPRGMLTRTTSEPPTRPPLGAVFTLVRPASASFKLSSRLAGGDPRVTATGLPSGLTTSRRTWVSVSARSTYSLTVAMSPRANGPLTWSAMSRASSARSRTTQSCRPVRTVLAVYSADAATPTTASTVYVVASRPRSVFRGFLWRRFNTVEASLLGQAIAYATDSMQIHRAARIWLDLLADHANVHVEGALIAEERRTPHAGE